MLCLPIFLHILISFMTLLLEANAPVAVHLSEIFSNSKTQPAHLSLQSGKQTVVAISEGRLFKRDIRTSSQALDLKKFIQVVDAGTNPDTFRVMVVGIPAMTNSTFFNLTIVEMTSGLEQVQVIVPSTPEQLQITNSFTKYSLGDYAAKSGNFTFTYEATLSRNGLDVADNLEIVTIVEYFTSKQVSVFSWSIVCGEAPYGACSVHISPTDVASSALFQIECEQFTMLYLDMTTKLSVNASLCVSKNDNVLKQSCVWCSVLIIIGCFVLGFLLAFCCFAVAMCVSTTSAVVTPSQQNKGSKAQTKKEVKSDTKTSQLNMMEVLLKDDVHEMYQDIKRMELDRMESVYDKIENERFEIVQAIAKFCKKEVSSCTEELASEAVKECKERPNHSSFDSKTDNAFFDTKLLRIKHEKELQDVMQRTKHYTPKFQGNMAALVEKRHACNTTDAELYENIASLLQNYKVNPRAANYLLASSEVPANDVFDVPNDDMATAHLQNALFQQLKDIFYENALAIQENTMNRKEMVAIWSIKKENEKKVWNKMATQQLELTKMASREQLISVTEKEVLCQNTIAFMKSAKANYLTEVKKGGTQLLSQYETLSNRSQVNEFLTAKSYLENSGSIWEWLDTTVKKFRDFLRTENDLEKQMNNTAQHDFGQFFVATSMQLRRDIEDAGKQLKEALTEAGVKRSWLSRATDEQDQELRAFLQDLQTSTAAPMELIAKNDVVDNDVSVLLLKKTVVSQPLKTDKKLNVLILENTLLATFCSRAFQQYLSSRLRAQRHLIEEKQERIAIVPDGEVETEIAKELQDKADIAAKLQFPGKRLHFDDMKQTRWFSSAFNDAARMELTDVVNHCFMKLSEESKLERDRQVVETLMMTALKCMTSTREMTPDGCKVVLQEYKTRTEATQQRFSAELKRQEEILKRKAERSVKLKNNLMDKMQNEGFTSQKSLLEAANTSIKILRDANIRMNEERETLQELFSTRCDVMINRNKTLMEQEILFVRELITAAGINGQDVQTAVQLLMPEKSSEYISKLSIMLCSNRDKENISERKSPQLFLPFIQKLTKSEKRQVEQEDSVLNQRFPAARPRRRDANTPIDAYDSNWCLGVRPEPLGRTATPENEKHWHKNWTQ